MKRTGIASWAVVVPLAIAGCTPQGDGGKWAPAAAAPPGIVYEANVPAGGVEPVPGGAIKCPSSTPDPAKAGEGLFGSMNCDGCHGGGAVGWVGPSLVDGRWRYGGSNGGITNSVYYGRTKGKPGHG